MFNKSDELDFLYDEIRHLGKKLTDNQIKEILSLLKNIDFCIKEKFFGSAVLCLSLGSNYIEENPLYFKEFFKNKLDDYNLGELYKAIIHSNVTSYYINEIVSSASFQEGDFGDSCYYAVIALGQYINTHHDKDKYKLLYKEYFSAFKRLEENVDESVKEEIVMYVKVCFNALEYALTKKYTYVVTIEEILDKSIPSELP